MEWISSAFGRLNSEADGNDAKFSSLHFSFQLITARAGELASILWHSINHLNLNFIANLQLHIRVAFEFYFIYCLVDASPHKQYFCCLLRNTILC